jgi:hypothetical protein
MRLRIGIPVEKGSANPDSKYHCEGEGQSGTGNPHNFISDANNAPVAGLGRSSGRVWTIALISSAVCRYLFFH